MNLFSPRVGKLRLISRLSEREDGTNQGIQLGLTTYGTTESGDETYQVSYVEIGGRSDHLADAIRSSQGNEVPERLVKEASADDIHYVGTVKQNAKAQKADAKSDDTQEAAAA